jgi:sporulation protein YlmC with PRC-barrel domain
VEANDGVSSRKQVARLGQLLAASAGYQVRTAEGKGLGRVENVRYERHADRPDEIVVRAPGLLRGRKRTYPLSAVQEVVPRERVVVINPADENAA